MTTLFIDTETTGLHRNDGDDLVEVAVVDDDGALKLSTLVDPGRPIPAAAIAIHGITNEMVAGAPSADEVRRIVADLCACHDVVIYNASFDKQFLDLSGASSIACCMLRFAEFYGEWNEYYGNYRWQRLATTAFETGFQWPTTGPHRALADAMACCHVWRWLGARDAAAMLAEERGGRTACGDENVGPRVAAPVE